jgi:hypothetical protein
MSISVIFIFRFAGNLDEYEHDYVSDEVGQRMHGVSHQSRAMAQNSSDEFEHQKKEVDDTSNPGYLVY